MVNASLNWASIVGIVLAVSGAGLYFLRSFKPALARDYDVFFAAIGLLCGGILFFQGWRLDPILQFGQFLLAGTTVFFAYESVRLRGVATDQARRSSFFDDEFDAPPMPNRGFRGPDGDDFDRFQEPPTNRRRFSSPDSENYDQPEEDFYRSRRTARPAIPEQAASRRNRPQRESLNQDSVQSRRMARFRNSEDQQDKRSNFGDRRTSREGQRRGSRPSATSEKPMNRRGKERNSFNTREENQNNRDDSFRRYREPQGAPIDRNAEDAAFSSKDRRGRIQDAPAARSQSSPRGSASLSNEKMRSSRPSFKSSKKPRDNSSRFDD